MKEKPIIFSSGMIRAILENRKSQTRRVVKPQPTRNHHITKLNEPGILGDKGFYEVSIYANRVPNSQRLCPYGKPGDRLWVKETFCHTTRSRELEDKKLLGYKTDFINDKIIAWTPSIYMPRWASRITLEITDIRVERLQEITHEGMQLEGIKTNSTNKSHLTFQWIDLWNSIHKKEHGWEDNPWCWVISFKKIEEKR